MSGSTTTIDNPVPFGNFTANFKEHPPPIPQQYL